MSGPEPLKPGLIGGTIKRNLKGQFVKGFSSREGKFVIPQTKLEEIKRFYFEERKSLSKIARIFSCNLETVRLFFIRNNLDRRSSTEGTRIIASDPDLRKKRSENAKGNKNPHFGKPASKNCGFGRVGIREDLNQYFRSSWEANIARLLNYYGILWKYEPQTFVLREISYTPDFLIYDTYLEIKGVYLKNSGEKIRRFKETYPELKYFLIDSKMYRQIERVYHLIIPNWEYR